ncbi:leucine-responsive transcriptional regulator Lrp [Psychrobium sp. 1_MG-2023]|uniref:leucine-responsive transcriptional regulator Lrp n=1 Tax=Psychrobium sp. 1_MG-2023 TaxID=3062624 RepID=UPI000C34AB94|nr:leucine-responsive transcriptional regulator Lrp [Psychrobium sp. 1_MG-2023]MDP2561868.1 leucine-responsive transcriptional regulator Lrp [Psychrobium sp. 1_MG-2023]PKF59717.1 leucine-responsive transcriptional regulator Lrp [Alteromonadales bacterium alter-6D02]
MELDRIDKNILRELQKNCKISNVELAKRVGLSPTPCLERVKRLEKNNVILQYTALLDPSALNAALLVYVEIKLHRTSADVFDRFNLAAEQLDAILECHLVSGDFDYLLKTRVSDMSTYRQVLNETLLSLPDIKDSRTYVVMEEVKYSTQINIEA